MELGERSILSDCILPKPIVYDYVNPYIPPLLKNFLNPISNEKMKLRNTEEKKGKRKKQSKTNGITRPRNRSATSTNTP